MAVDQLRVKCEKGAWTQLTNADADVVTWQALDNSVFIRFTEDATQPTYDGSNSGIIYHYNEGERKMTLTDISTLVAPKRVWATPISASVAEVLVDHADAA